jgi:hypothetical protein
MEERTMKRTGLVMIGCFLLTAAGIQAKSKKPFGVVPEEVMAGMKAFHKKQFEENLDYLGEQIADVKKYCKYDLEVEIEWKTFVGSSMVERLSWPHVPSFCANHIWGLVNRCSSEGGDGKGDVYKKAAAQRIKKIVCWHDPQGLWELQENNDAGGGSFKFEKGGVFRIGYTSSEKGTTNTMGSGLAIWLKGNL